MPVAITNIVREKTSGVRDAFDDYGVVCTWEEMEKRGDASHSFVS